MGYSKLIQKRKEHAGHVVSREPFCRDDSLKCEAPVFGVFFSAIVSGSTGLVGSIFFAYKWFECLNYLIGKKLFKSTVLAGVWATLLGMSVASIWLGSSWLLVVMWVCRIALLAYLLSQLRRCRECKPIVIRSIKIWSGMLYALWTLGILFIGRCGSVRIWRHIDDSIFGLIILAILILFEVSMIQKMFNLVVCDTAVNRDILDKRITGDWCRLRIAVVWGVVALSILLFSGISLRRLLGSLITVVVIITA